MLRQEGAGDGVAQVSAQPEQAAERTDLVAPAQLPRDLSTFSGRDADLARILTSVRSPGPTTTIALIDGMPGAGKTTLAVRLAYEVAGDFPDGQLFVNLRGFDPRGSVMPPDEALRGFLYALGTPGSQIPADLDAQIGLYRSLLRDKRMLVVLDNARDVDHVLPLIPGSPGCLVVVTSRNRLTGLVTLEGTHPFTLDPMPIDDARAMVKSRLGARRSEREPEAVDRIVAMCARLPLALAIVAARAASYPDVPLSVIANELTDAKGSLDAFSYDGTSDLRAVFSWSYLALTPPTARMFRLLALHWGPDISLAAAASLLGVPVKAARKRLGELTRTRLMTEHLPGRYQFHDLVRVYAIELSDDLETEQERQDAIRRMADHYLHSAHSIHLVLRPHQQPVPISSPAPNVTIETVADYDAAMAWFLAEQEVLHSVVVRAAECGFADHAWQLALTMQRFFQLQGLHLAWSATMRVALSAARASGDPVGEARTLRSLAGAYYFADDTETALAYLKRTDELLDQLGWTTEKAYVQRNMGDVLAKRNVFVDDMTDGADFAQAIKCYERAAELYRAAGHEQGEMFAIEGIAVCTLRMGAADEAIELLHQVLAGFERLGDRTGQANCLSELGSANLRVNRFDQAASYFRRAIDMHRSDAYHYSVLADLLALGDALSQTADIEGARAAWLEALALMDNSRITMIGHAAVSYNEVRQRIAALDQPG